MSAVYYCDICSKQMKIKEHSRLKRRLGKLCVEVMHGFNGCSNAGNICHDCIMNCVNKGKP